MISSTASKKFAVLLTFKFTNEINGYIDAPEQVLVVYCFYKAFDILTLQNSRKL